MDRQEEFHHLLLKYQQGLCSPEELHRLNEWLEQRAAAGDELDFGDDEERSSLQARMRRAVMEGIGAPAAQIRGELAVTKLASGATETDPGGNAEGYSERRRIPGHGRRWILAGAMAASLLTAVAALYFYARQQRDIVLVSGAGEVKKMVLPDGSTVWLNDNSELVYHGDFSTHRIIELRRGEAFFQVRTDPMNSFIVRSQELNTLVLGTSFSVKVIGSPAAGHTKGLPGGDIKISVATGKVLVRHAADTLGMLRPLQRLRYAGSTGVAVTDSAMGGEADSWTRGELFLQNAGIEEVMQWLRGHFNVNTTNEHHNYAGQYYLQARSDISLSQVVKILNLLGTKNHVRFILKDQTIIIQ